MFYPNLEFFFFVFPSLPTSFLAKIWVGIICRDSITLLLTYLYITNRFEFSPTNALFLFCWFCLLWAKEIMAYTCGFWVLGRWGLMLHCGGCEGSRLCNSPCCGELDEHEFPHNTFISLCLCFLYKWVEKLEVLCFCGLASGCRFWGCRFAFLFRGVLSI